MARQKMLTEAILKKVPALYSQDGKGMDAIAYAKFFNPCGSQSWFMSEYDPETGLAFGYVTGTPFPELGYFSLDELAEIRLPMGLYIERDIHFTPKPLKDCS